MKIYLLSIAILALTISVTFAGEDHYSPLPTLCFETIEQCQQSAELINQLDNGEYGIQASCHSETSKLLNCPIKMISKLLIRD
ncbi:MAG: hypothetical protein HN353_11390 [Bdellovibrionales bacterium]|jgi:hypothetical protein|nr:hypothetical protein [Bdellovibrionales bacterium]MBT3525741.1 hypothetical protein [Bdellovibrionales bacterium]MBT7669611.1 hypothetical protein [Bdellovibrionales bacterium]MBT7767182.1 hypothetical protein [Bdellovibrionales bacterium]